MVKDTNEKEKSKLMLAQVDYFDSGKKKATLTFIDPNTGYSFEQAYNLQGYNPEAKSQKDKFFDDPEKEQKVREEVKKRFACEFEDLESCVEKTYDMYEYGKYVTFEPIQEPVHFKDEQIKSVVPCIIKSVFTDGKALKVRYTEKSNHDILHETKFGYGFYMKKMNKWFTNKDKEIKAYLNFEEALGMPFDEAVKSGDLTGKEVNIYVDEFQGVPFGKITKA